MHLKLTSTCYWGWIPKCDLRGIHFPKLKSLELGELTFTHDWQLEWIISHGSTLTQLSLRECPIVHDIWIDHSLDTEGYPVHTLGAKLTWDETAGYPGEWCGNGARWKDHFPRLMSGLPRLRHLVVGDISSSAPKIEGMAEDSWRTLYCAFWSELSFSPWASDHPCFGKGYDGLHYDDLEPKASYPQCKEEDLRALERLMTAVKRRAGHLVESL